jgi:inosine-uridine nucleoside N-ribohydrolase
MKKRSAISRRHFLQQTIAFAGAAGLAMTRRSAAWATPPPEMRSARKPIPVILATDIGDDIDDTWALGFLLRCPELDLKLVLGEYGKSQYRAKLIAKFLQTVGRSDVPVGLGADADPRGEGAQAGWIRNYDLNSYPGPLHRDGAQALIDTINQSPDPVTVICIAPMPNLAAALARDPQIARRARFVGMCGSLRVGYNGSKTVSAEWNVKADANACQAVFAAPWEKTITPLDTCGLVNLDGQRYRRLCDSKDPVAMTVIENYRLWSKANNNQDAAAQTHSSILFDTVAVYLACAQDFCRMENLGVRVSDDGFTTIDEKGNRVAAATAWLNLDAFRDLLVARLTGTRTARPSAPV